jgi:hypothetical protein
MLATGSRLLMPNIRPSGSEAKEPAMIPRVTPPVRGAKRRFAWRPSSKSAIATKKLRRASDVICFDATRSRTNTLD